MYKRRSSTRSGLFLIELIIAILFFSLASAICIQLFVKAHLVSTNSKDLSMALNQAQSAAEDFKASNGTFTNLKHIMGGEYGDNDNEIILKYDKDWNTVVTNPIYQLTVVLNEQNPVTAVITVKKAGDNTKQIYKVEAKKYIFDK